jgi:hypothetical protein
VAGERQKEMKEIRLRGKGVRGLGVGIPDSGEGCVETWQALETV